MSFSLHVVAHRTTDVVLAAYTRSGTAEDLLGAIGDELPIRYTKDGDKTFTDLATVANADLVDEAVPGATTFAIDSVLDAPLGYVVIRDQNGKAQGVQPASAVTPTNPAPLGALTVTFPAPIDLAGRAGWVRLVQGTQVFDTNVTFIPTSMANLNEGSATVTAPPGTYTLFLLVKGFAACVLPGLNVT